MTDDTHDSLNDRMIIDCWGKNARPWIVAIEQRQIESRRRVTDQAIIDAVLATDARSLLDLGCGEGWLMQSLAGQGLEVAGLEVVPELLQQAREKVRGRFYPLAYEALSAQTVAERFDLVVCNFSLLGEASVDHIFSTVPDLLTPGGQIVVQTLHPLMVCGEQPYQDGWRPGSWAGLPECLGQQFAEPPPWYFRTLESWLALFRAHGFSLTGFKEPRHPDTGQPASVILTGQPSR